MLNYFPINENSEIISYDALLPNLKYKNGNIFFISKEQISFQKEFLLNNISLTGEILCIRTKINFKILEKEVHNGLIINIQYKEQTEIFKQDRQKIARAIEASILGIDLMDDNNSDIDDFSYTNYLSLEEDNEEEYDEEDDEEDDEIDNEADNSGEVIDNI